MKPILLMLALAMLVTAGCAAQQPDQDAILDCNSYADGQVKARYTPEWDKAVQQCLEMQAQ